MTRRWIVCFLCAALASRGGAQQPSGLVPPLRGHVRTIDGRPLADAEVTVEGVKAIVRTDAQGAFSIPNVPKGFRTLRVRRIGYLPASMEIDVPAVAQPGEGPVVTLVVSHTELDTVKVQAKVNVLAGVVVDSRNRPIPGASVSLVGDGLRTDDTTGADGWFTFPAVRSGPVIVHVLREGYVSAIQSININEWRGVVVRMADMDMTLSKTKQGLLSGLGNTIRNVWLETNRRLSRRNIQAVVVTNEELQPLHDLNLGDAINRAPSAIHLMPEMQSNHGVACVLLNGNQQVGPVTLDAYDTEDVEFVELYPSSIMTPSSVRAYLQISGCSQALTTAVIWMKH